MSSRRHFFCVQLLAWILKLANHPTPARSLGEFVDRADIGILNGGTVLALVSILALGTTLFALKRGGVDRVSG